MTMDYIGNKAHAQLLADTVTEYYRSRGYSGVRAQVIPRMVSNSQGDRVAVHYDVRSNLVFNCKDII